MKRVLSRLFAISEYPGKKKTEQRLWNISESLIPKGHSNSFNQSLMDLGSMVCTPKEPHCPRCPLHLFCKGRASGEPERFPAKGIKRTIPHVESVSAVIKKDGKVLLNQRPPSGLLGGLWEFPNWKVNGKEDFKKQLERRLKSEVGIRIKVREPVATFRQTYSHFKLTLHVFHCESTQGKGKGKWIPIRNLHQIPMSRIYRRIANALSDA